MMKKSRVVVKVGTSTVAHDNGKINLRRIEKLARVISEIKNSGNEIILVSSGAVGIGRDRIGISERPKTTREKQAAAAVGQCELMNIYGKLFAEYGYHVAQILLTKDVLDKGHREENAVNTFNTLLEFGVVPIVNENDPISAEEIEFGDNDTLSAVVAVLTKADLLILLTDIDGLYDSDPRDNPDAKLIGRVEKIDESVFAMAGNKERKMGTGGMTTKIRAAQIATEKGINMIVANGENPEILYEIFDGKEKGTLFAAEK
ncbi:MAG: glutamate 5-kinase [Clostridia bacterium]|nr:glutamate 5-kinase [Clostridia bacterium]